MLDKLEYRFLPFNVWSFLYLHHYTVHSNNILFSCSKEDVGIFIS